MSVAGGMVQIQDVVREFFELGTWRATSGGATRYASTLNAHLAQRRLTDGLTSTDLPDVVDWGTNYQPGTAVEATPSLQVTRLGTGEDLGGGRRRHLVVVSVLVSADNVGNRPSAVLRALDLIGDEMIAMATRSRRLRTFDAVDYEDGDGWTLNGGGLTAEGRVEQAASAVGGPIELRSSPRAESPRRPAHRDSVFLSFPLTITAQMDC